MPTPMRCVAHPGRPAVDRCPVCGRPRCGADAREPGCAVCRAAAVPAPTRAAASPRELLVRAGLAGLAVSYVAGPVLSEYVGAPVYGYLAPAVIGIAAAEAVATAARAKKGTGLLRGWALLVAVLGVGLGFRIEGTYSAWHLSSTVLLPYLAACAGVWLWTAPPRRRYGFARRAK